MVQFIRGLQQPQGRLSEQLGQAIAQGINQRQQMLQQQEQGSLLSKVLSGQASPEELAQLNPQMQLEAQKLMNERGKVQQKQQMEQQKQLREQQESELLSKIESGQELTQEEKKGLSPTSLRALLTKEKPVFEPTEQRLEAERVSKFADQIETDYQAALSEDQRIKRMESLSEKGDLSNPVVVKALNAFGLPISVLGNPDTEEFQKLEADFLRDVRNVFPGGRITNYEIQSYMKTVPSLMNSKEGKEAIMRNRKLLNEAKKLKYDAYKDILKENNGVKPRNLGILLQERVGNRLAAIENDYIDGINKDIEKFQTPLQMVGPDGSLYAIPPAKIEAAVKEGFKFQ